MSESHSALEQAAPEISFDQSGKPTLPVGGRLHVRHPDYVNALPFVKRARTTWTEFREHVVGQGLPEPTQLDWADTFQLTDSEIDAVRAMQDSMYLGDIRELEPYFFVRHFGNKPRVCWRQADGLLGHMSKHEFRTAHIEKKIEVGENKDGTPRYRLLADHWLEHSRTPRYDRVEFLPGQRPWEVPEDVYNLWAGWPEGLPRERDLMPHVLGDVIPDDDDDDDPLECCIFLEHLREHACGGDDAVFDYLLGWIADMLQRPGPSETAVCMTGPSGSGKGTIANLIGSLAWPHYIVVNSREALTGKFNRHLMEAQLVFADEVDFSGADQAAKTLRNLVTEPTLTVEPRAWTSSRCASGSAS